MIYHVRFVCAADYNARRLPFRPAHLAQLVDLRDAGRVVAGGPEPDGSAAHIFYRVRDAAELTRAIGDNVFQRAGLFASHQPRAFAEFLAPIDTPPVDAALAMTVVEGAPGDVGKARAGLDAMMRDGRAAFGGFFDDDTGLAAVRTADADDALDWLHDAGWDRERMSARAWSQTL